MLGGCSTWRVLGGTQPSLRGAGPEGHSMVSGTGPRTSLNLTGRLQDESWKAEAQGPRAAPVGFRELPLTTRAPPTTPSRARNPGRAPSSQAALPGSVPVAYPRSPTRPLARPSLGTTAPMDERDRIRRLRVTCIAKITSSSCSLMIMRPKHGTSVRKRAFKLQQAKALRRSEITRFR